MSNTNNSGKMVAGVIGVATGIAAIATGYYFYGKGGKEHRKEASAWTVKAKKEMVKKIEQMKEVTQEAYNKAADEISAKYKLLKNIDPKELQSFIQELKAHWEQISKDAAKLGHKSLAKKA